MKDIKYFIQRNLLERYFLKRNDIEFSYFKNTLKNYTVKSEMETIWKNKTFTCDEGLNLAFAISKLYNTEKPIFLAKIERGLIKNLIYQYVQHDIYTDILETPLKEYILDPKFKRFANLYIRIMKVFNKNSKLCKKNGWEYQYQYNSLKPEEYKNSAYKYEYKRFLHSFKNQHVYLMYKMSQQWKGFSLFNHVLGVHYLCMHIGRQMKEKGFPVNLPLLSSAAIAHDIGKFGCKKNELKNIAYYHYYYTKVWFDNNKLTSASHYATNHSIWDLEELRLPTESLILIYSDFRVKDRQMHDGNKKMSIFSNEESFDVIRDKLDDLDNKKLKRYKRAYKRLEDLETMFHSLGIDTDIHLDDYDDKYAKKTTKKQKKYIDAVSVVKGEANSDFISMMKNKDIIHTSKVLNVVYNVFIMDKMRDVASLKTMFEKARLSNNRNDIKIYLSIIDGYSDFFTLEQLELCFDFLFGLLSNSEDDIRYQSAKLIGKFILGMRKSYTRYLPPDKEDKGVDKTDQYLHRILNLLDYVEKSDPKGMVTERMVYNVPIVIRKLLKTAKGERREHFSKIVVNRILNDKKPVTTFTTIYSCEILADINMFISDEDLKRGLPYILKNLSHKDLRVRLMAQRAIYFYTERNLWEFLGYENFQTISKVITKSIEKYNNSTEIYYYYKIFGLLNSKSYKIVKEYVDEKTFNKVSNILNNIDIRNMFLKNLKISTSWVEKKANCLLLVDYSYNIHKMNPNSSYLLDIALHLSNILVVAKSEGTRFQAGTSLLNLAKILSPVQLNEIAVELLRTLEMDFQSYAHFIPRVLGRIIPLLKEDEMKEILSEIGVKIKEGHENLQQLYLETLAVMLAQISDDNAVFKKARLKVLGIMTGAMVSQKTFIKQQSQYIIGMKIFKSDEFNPQYKKKIITLALKKILTLLHNDSDDFIDTFYTASMLNYLYIFISNYEHKYGEVIMNKDKPIAFFPGTFDPFSLSHLEITKQCTNDGYELFIQVDEFSWRKRTIAPALRKDIIRTSISNLLHVHLFPVIPPINIANEDDLHRLQKCFKNKDIFMVVGADVISNATAYKKQTPITSFNHYIVYRKDTKGKAIHKSTAFKKGISSIQGKKVYKELESHFSFISSSKIRKFIDDGRSIDHLVDKRAEIYIKRNSLYVRQLEEKHLADIPQYEEWVKKIEFIDNFWQKIPPHMIDNFIAKFREYNINGKEEIYKFLVQKKCYLYLLKNRNDNDKTIGLIIYHHIRNQGVYNIVRDVNVSEYQRNNTFGKLAYIILEFCDKDHFQSLKNYFSIFFIQDNGLFILQEFKQQSGVVDKSLERIENLSKYYSKLLGSYPIPHVYKKRDIKYELYITDLRKPVVLLADLDDIIKNPYKRNKYVRRQLEKNRERMMETVSALNPERPVLMLKHEELVYYLLNRIADINDASLLEEKQTGDYVCMLLGDILGKYLVPNTITKSLHIEDVVSRSGKIVGLKASKFYNDLSTQLKTIKTFNKKEIIADVFVHSPLMIQDIINSSKKDGIKIEKVVSGIMTGLAKEIFDENNIETESVFFLPRITKYFEEHMLYPYIGGHSIDDYLYTDKTFTRSIVDLMPFSPFEKEKKISTQAQIEFSKVMLQNSIKLFEELEKIYLDINKKNIHLVNIMEIIERPKIPVYNPECLPSFQLKVSELLKKDLETLMRFI